VGVSSENAGGRPSLHWSFSFSRKDAFPSDIKSSKKKKNKLKNKKRGDFFLLV